jgi:predicted DNA-binding transcriptional regulator YafY
MDSMNRRDRSVPSRRPSSGGRERRVPTYGAAVRLARIVHGLSSRPHGWSFAAIQNELRISERTLLRYLAVCRSELIDAGGQPIFEVVRHGDRRLLRLTDRGVPQEATPYEISFLYFALTVFQFLEGTVVKEGVEGLWERLYRALPDTQRLRLADFARKFHSIPYAVKDYSGFDETLDVVVQCLVHQYRMRIDYGGLLGDGKVHEFDPYTLTMYRGGLYLIGYTHRVRKITTLAVERIRKAEKLTQHFTYPKRYSPAKYTEGMFGIIGGPRARVELLLLNPETAAFLSARQVHPTQRFRALRNGTTQLSMMVRGTTELASWILSLGPYVKVLRPRDLREEVHSLLARAAALYDGKTTP